MIVRELHQPPVHCGEWHRVPLILWRLLYPRFPRTLWRIVGDVFPLAKQFTEQPPDAVNVAYPDRFGLTVGTVTLDRGGNATVLVWQFTYDDGMPTLGDLWRPGAVSWGDTGPERRPLSGDGVFLLECVRCRQPLDHDPHLCVFGWGGGGTIHGGW